MKSNRAGLEINRDQPPHSHANKNRFGFCARLASASILENLMPHYG